MWTASGGLVWVLATLMSGPVYGKGADLQPEMPMDDPAVHHYPSIALGRKLRWWTTPPPAPLGSTAPGPTYIIIPKQPGEAREV